MVFLLAKPITGREQSMPHAAIGQNASSKFYSVKTSGENASVPARFFKTQINIESGLNSCGV
ncbi:hypothetical protein [Acidovorax sp. RAC01]|uniref:hypothetical protein n=1 Tax=Acidovorax sp. RAC01 TaxID=1842533 RepID=UPI0018D3095A|nr:hypothetical protein [Acidovorax sp. RAC01]